MTNQDTILLPIQDATRQELETENLYIFGSVPLELQKFLLEGYGRNPVVKIACGKYHYIILLTNNRLIGFGLNNVGQLGLPVETKEVTQITELKINLPNCFTPSTHEILVDKKFKEYELHWYLLTITSAKKKIMKIPFG